MKYSYICVYPREHISLIRDMECLENNMDKLEDKLLSQSSIKYKIKYKIKIIGITNKEIVLRIKSNMDIEDLLNHDVRLDPFQYIELKR
jgi:uncharacterized transporter YbjL